MPERASSLSSDMGFAFLDFLSDALSCVGTDPFTQQHISHPNITPLLAHLSISTHHILVLPYLSGGDLLGLVNNDVAWGKLGTNAPLGFLLNEKK